MNTYRKVPFTGATLLVVLALLLAACGATPEPQVIKETVPVEVTKLVEQTVPVEVTKVVQETVVEVVTATPEPEGQPRQGGTVTFAFSAGWDVLDPAATAFTMARNIMQFIYDPILRMDPTTGAIVPGLAESYDLKDDRVITLNLRKDVTFHDGTPFNAEALKFSLDRIQDPELKSPYAATLSGPVESIEVLDEYTLVITLKEPYAPFLNSLTQISLAPVSPTAVEQWGADYGAHPTGTGPFIFQEEVPNERIVLVGNPDYNWAPDYYNHQGPPYLDELIVLNVEEASTRMAMAETGEIDLVYTPINRQVPDFEADPNFYVVYGTRPGVPRVFVLTSDRPPFDDSRVRMAVAYAVDKERILAETFEGIGAVAYSVLTPGLMGYCEECKDLAPTFDPDKAKELLAEAGWADSNGDGILEKDGTEFRITFGTIPGVPFDTTNQIVQSNLKDVGIEMEIVGEEQAAVLQHMREGTFNMTDMLFVATDPDVLYTVLHSSSIDAAWNTARYSTPELDKLLEQGRTTVDAAERAKVYEDIQKLELEQLPYVPYYVIKNPYIVNERVKDFRVDIQAFLDFYDAWVTD